MATADRLEYVLAGRDELTKPLRQAENQMKRLGAQAQKTDKQMSMFGSNLVGTGRNFKKFAMGSLQQAGFQLGDYAVQVANGTSRMQAFGQQAPQFLQIFGPIGSAVGAAVAVFAAYAVVQEKTGEASKSLTDNLIPLDKALQNVKKSTSEARAQIALLVSGFKSAEEASLANAITLQEQVVAQKQLNMENARGAAKVGAETQLKTQQGILQNLVDQLDALRTGNKERAHTLDALTDIIGSTEGLKQSEQALNDIFEARIGKIDDTANLYVDILGSEDGLGKAVAANNKLYTDRLGTIDKTASGYVDVLGSETGLRASTNALNSIFSSRLGTIDDTANKYVDILGSEDGLRAAVEANVALFESRLGTIDKTALEYVDILGSESGLGAAVAANNQLYLERLGTIDDIANNYVDVLGSEGGLKDATDALNQMFEDRLGTIDDTANEYVDILGSERGLAAAVAATNAMYAARQGTIDTTANEYVDVLGSEQGLKLAVEGANQLYADRLKALQDAADQAARTPDPLGDLSAQVKLNQDLLGATDARRQVMQAIHQSERQYTPQQIEDTIKQIDAYNKQVKEMERIKSTADMIGDAFENAFMSMIDGTKSAKDAFKDLTRSIIADLYRQYVVKQITGFISNAITSSFGVTPTGGGGGGKAIGGPVQAGQSYLVGERGPEMFVPARSGSIVPNDRLGAGGVVVNQTFQFSANGDDSVKQIIAKAAPTIAKMAQQGIIDARRRGGQVKQVFG